MNLDRNLNLVVPVERLDGTTIYVHSTPISRETFKQNFLLIAKSFATIYSQNLNVLAGPRVAAMMIKQVAADTGQGVSSDALFAEMHRLSNVIQLGADGQWSYVPLSLAQQHGIIDADDVDEVENILAFFTLASSMHKRKDAKALLTMATDFWGALLTSLDCTAYISSLPTSTPGASIGAKVLQSSIPS